MSKERREIIAKLKRRLDEAAGTKTPWEAIEEALDKMPLRALRALEYRIERALSESYDLGLATGQGRVGLP